MAVNALAAAGYTNAYNIIDGFEGDKVADATSPDHGKRRCNGWTNSGLPWTYAVDPSRLRYRQPERPTRDPTPSTQGDHPDD